MFREEQRLDNLFLQRAVPPLINWSPPIRGECLVFLINKSSGVAAAELEALLQRDPGFFET